MPKVTIEADTLEELEELASRIAARPPGGLKATPEPVGGSDLAEAWASFLRGRSDGHRLILTALRESGGRVTLSALSESTGLAGDVLAGTLGSLIRASSSHLGATLIETKPWFQNEQGRADREYVVRPEFLGLLEDSDIGS